MKIIFLQKKAGVNFLAYRCDLNSKEIVAIHMNTEIYPGSSGGPLFYKGVVIGVNTFKVENTNLNFAIHFNHVNNFISQNNL